MIPARTALTLDRALQPRPPLEPSVVPEEEQEAYDYLDAVIESSLFKDFSGEMFDVRIPPEHFSPQVVAAIKARYEEGGWTVGVFLHNDAAGDLMMCQIIFVPEQSDAKVVVEQGNVRVAVGPTVVVPLPPKYVRNPSEKPRVLLVSDVPNWAFDVNMHDLAEYLAGSFDFEHFYTETWFCGKRPDWSAFDVIYECYHRNPPMGIPMDRAAGALRSEFFKPEKQGPPDDEDVLSVNRYRVFQVACKKNYDELVNRCPNVMYLTNPVNTKRFLQVLKKDVLVCSWNGNAAHLSMDGRFIKHFYDIVVPACELAGVPLVAAEYSLKKGPMRRRMPAEMPEFYHQANVALCASEYEAASNSCMEAMASGLALIATDVGNHRELQQAQIAHQGDTGIILVERSVPAFVNAIKSLTPERAFAMGEINRREIETRWSWSVWKDAYHGFLLKALEPVS